MIVADVGGGDMVESNIPVIIDSDPAVTAGRPATAIPDQIFSLYTCRFECADAKCPAPDRPDRRIFDKRVVDRRVGDRQDVGRALYPCVVVSPGPGFCLS